MGYATCLFGKQICEKFNIPLVRLVELCHAGKLAAYHPYDEHQILASSQCNTKFKYLGNTTFTIAPPKGKGIIAISKKSIENFDMYVERKPSDTKIHVKNARDAKEFNEGVLEISKKYTKLRLENIREMSINYCDSEYIVFYNNLTVRPLNRPFEFVKLYGCNQVFFEITENECDINLEYIELSGYELDGYKKGCIKRCVTRLYVKKEQDNYGNSKFTINDYDNERLQIENYYRICQECGIIVDNHRLKRDSAYLLKYEDYCAYLQQYAVSYFNKDDSSYSRPLEHELDFFIFDYNEYKKRFHFFEDEEKVKKEFFNYIERLIFNEDEIRNVLKYEIEKKSISDDPKQYMSECCKKLEEIYKNDEKKLMIVKAYLLALKGVVWIEIDKSLWNHSEDKENSMIFVSRKLKKFEQIAADNKIPFIAAARWKNENVSKESIAGDILKQLAIFHTDG